MDTNQKHLGDDRDHVSKTSKRWREKHPLNHNVESPKYNDDWSTEECLGCQYYIKLKGFLGMDWGVCSNQKSPFDGNLMFEHDGCDYFSIADEGS